MISCMNSGKTTSEGIGTGIGADTNGKGRLLGVDYGSKRVGVAVSDEGRKLAFPVSVVANTPELLAEIEKIALDNETREIVMGESRDYAGQPNEVMLASVEFKEKLEADGYTVHFEPEFMSSVQAERWQGKNDKSDSSAAAIILQSYLDKLNS